MTVLADEQALGAGLLSTVGYPLSVLFVTWLATVNMYGILLTREISPNARIEKMRSVSPIPNDVLLEKFDSLSGEVRITPEQLSMILGISVYSLQEKRHRGNFLPHVREGVKVLYRIKDVRKYLKMQPVYENTLEYFQAKKEEHLGLPAVLNDDVV